MNILITGGAGYIGSHVVKQLGENTLHSLKILDNLSTGKAEAVLYGNLIREDLSNTKKVEEIIEKGNFEAVIHFSASITVPESIENPMKYYLNNTANTINLVNLCIKYKIKNFIFSSTAAVYGETDNTPVKESVPLNPINPYGMSKLMSEKVIIDAGKSHPDFKYVILRYFNVSGADINNKIGQSSPNATNLIKVAAETASGKREKIYIFGEDYSTNDGTAIRDYIHVEDLADAHIKALDYLKTNRSNIFNCGYGTGYSVKEVVNTMRKVSGINFKTETTLRRLGDPEIVIADNSKIKTEMGWFPKYNDIELICKTAYSWENFKNY